MEVCIANLRRPLIWWACGEQQQRLTSEAEAAVTIKIISLNVDMAMLENLRDRNRKHLK